MIDFDALQKVYDASERESNIDMGSWKKVWKCQTSHCMIGAFCNENKDDALQLVYTAAYDDMKYYQLRLTTEKVIDSSLQISKRFSITYYEASWIFTSLVKDFADDWIPALYKDKAEALARLQKFIAYKKAKASLVTTHGRNGYIIDKGRTIAGISSLAS